MVLISTVHFSYLCPGPCATRVNCSKWHFRKQLSVRIITIINCRFSDTNYYVMHDIVWHDGDGWCDMNDSMRGKKWYESICCRSKSGVLSSSFIKHKVNLPNTLYKLNYFLLCLRVFILRRQWIPSIFSWLFYCWRQLSVPFSCDVPIDSISNILSAWKW